MPFNTNESSDRGEGSGQQAGSEAAGSGQHRSLKVNKLCGLWERDHLAQNILQSIIDTEVNNRR